MSKPSEFSSYMLYALAKRGARVLFQTLPSQGNVAVLELIWGPKGPSKSQRIVPVGHVFPDDTVLITLVEGAAAFRIGKTEIISSPGPLEIVVSIGSGTDDEVFTFNGRLGQEMRDLYKKLDSKKVAGGGGSSGYQGKTQSRRPTVQQSAPKRDVKDAAKVDAPAAMSQNRVPREVKPTVGSRRQKVEPAKKEKSGVAPVSAPGKEKEAVSANHSSESAATFDDFEEPVAERSLLSTSRVVRVLSPREKYDDDEDCELPRTAQHFNVGELSELADLGQKKIEEITAAQFASALDSVEI
jgi:hypothetical protein